MDFEYVFLEKLRDLFPGHNFRTTINDNNTGVILVIDNEFTDIILDSFYNCHSKYYHKIEGKFFDKIVEQINGFIKED